MYCILLTDLTVNKTQGTSNKMEIQFAASNNLYLCFSFIKLAETLYINMFSKENWKSTIDLRTHN